MFVGKDEAGKAKFACHAEHYRQSQKDVYGSDKEYSFCYPPRNPGSRHVAVFEGTSDALSHAHAAELEGWKWDGYQRLSLGGTSMWRDCILEAPPGNPARQPLHGQ